MPGCPVCLFLGISPDSLAGKSIFIESAAKYHRIETWLYFRKPDKLPIVINTKEQRKTHIVFFRHRGNFLQCCQRQNPLILRKSNTYPYQTVVLQPAKKGS